MPRHQLDRPTRFSEVNYEKLQDRLSIEKADVEEVSRDKPELEEQEKEPYLAEKPLVQAVDLAIALGRPLLLQGDPGCGKTRLAYAVAYALGLPLEECYVKSTTRAQDLLYTHDGVRRLFDAQLRDPQAREPHKYVRLGPLGRAIARASYGRRSVVLLDEIDKADLDFPNDLLLELDRWRFAVAEVPSMKYDGGKAAELRPVVIVTHNEEKALPPAFLRRCVFHYLEFPTDPNHLQAVLKLHRSETPLTEKAIRAVLGLRQLDLSKKPGLSELIDWVGYLEAVNAKEEDVEQLLYSGVLLKQKSDIDRVGKALPTERATA
jgi:MoxR-like ATPase